ncbi:MAG TPA: prolyl oligopeptidase family serine peptidase, partial [Telluria sp.]|nr:prolyl oligopeptidase family serine peptidase [Telluria sp.]
ESIVATSPAANAARVKRPLVIIAGAKDPMVPVAGVTAYVEQLKAAGTPVSFLLDPDEGHMPRKPVVRQAYSYLLDSLLHRYLGADAPEAPSPELAAYLAGSAMKSNGALP